MRNRLARSSAPAPVPSCWRAVRSSAMKNCSSGWKRRAVWARWAARSDATSFNTKIPKPSPAPSVASSATIGQPAKPSPNSTKPCTKNNSPNQTPEGFSENPSGVCSLTMNYVIGCDVGSQGTKALLLSLDGELIGEAYAGYEIDYPFPLWAQQPVERWTNALRDAIRQLLHTTGVRGDAVQGLALGAQVEGVVAIDKNGAPLHPAIIWMDRRAVAQTNALRAHEDEIFQRTGLNLDATHVAPKIQWLTENEPRLSERVAHFLQPGSYVAFHLTGERAVDYSNASSTLLLDVRTKTWSPEMCAYFNINPSQLAPV